MLLGQDPRKLNNAALRQLRGEAVGLVFQDPMTRLNPLMSIGEHLLDTLKADLFSDELEGVIEEPTYTNVPVDDYAEVFYDVE